MKSFLCLLLSCHCVLNVQISREEVGGSEQSEKSLSSCLETQSSSCLVEVCRGQCLVTDTNNQENKKDLCEFGCRSMTNEFEDLKTKFSTTDPQYLLGNALDQCWEGCGDNFSAGISSCTSGCDAMRNIQKQIIKTAKTVNSEFGSSQETLEDFQPEN